MARLLRVSLRTVLLIALETGLIIAGVMVAVWLRLGTDGALRVVLEQNGILKAILIAAVAQLSLYYADLYDLRMVADRRELFVRSLQALGATSFLLAGVYFWLPDLIIGRGVFLLAAAIVLTVVMGWRIAFVWLARQAGPRERLLLVGTSQAAVGLARELEERASELGVEVVGFVDNDPNADTGPGCPPVVGAIDDIPRIVSKRAVDRVVVSLADARGKLPMDRLLDMKLAGVTFDHLATVYEEYTGKIALENLRPSWLIFSAGFRKTRWMLAAKRTTDITVSTVMFALALPVMLLAAAFVKMTSKGPAIYRQSRVGLNGRLFVIYKFRSMREDAEAKTGAVWAKPGFDPRVTSVGRILRRTRLDELPQLWNVIRGDMSFVGPRPERPEFVSELTRRSRSTACGMSSGPA